jgi:hypothetical protein
MDSVIFRKCSSLFLVHRTLASGAPDAGAQSIGRSLEPSIGRSDVAAPDAEVVLFMRLVAT